MTSRRIVTRAIYAREAASSRADLIGRHTLLDRLISRHARVHLITSISDETINGEAKCIRVC